MGKVIKYSNLKPTVYGTGLVALDIVIGSDANQPAYQWAGGTCGNVLTILSYLDWSSFPIARLNEDPSSECVRRDMTKWRVNLDFASLSPTASVPVITQEISTDNNGNPIHKFHLRNCPKCGSWLPNYKPVTLKGAEIVKEVVQKGEVFFFDRTSPSALALARHFKGLGCIIFFEPSAKGDPKHFLEAIKLADIVKYSDQRFMSIINKNTEVNRPFLEIQTLGGNGLRYRLDTQETWCPLVAFEAEELKDTCGCGDWTTAGIISKLCNEGRENLKQASKEKIELALRYGQALGAWNCGFEGARGGMYHVDKENFYEEINLILQEGKQSQKSHYTKSHAKYTSDGICPACPF